eukprot:EC714323.1.p1 GENE.EC714323.1~~EC714323.1.p1  ORF type:complete len:58 (+),score=1.18 EC714323.1:3-176(+)
MSYNECLENADHPSVCVPQVEDYMECLHHRKEYARLAAIGAERKRQEDSQKGHGGGH